jgi:hypothetical protein
MYISDCDERRFRTVTAADPIHENVMITGALYLS